MSALLASMSGFSKVWTTSWSRGKLKEIEVQVLVRSGLPRFDIIGLPENVIKEGKDRIRSVLHFLGINLPSQKILVSLNPAGDPKEGAHFDFPILAGILKAIGHLPQISDRRDFYWGELTLNGSIQKLHSPTAHLFLASLHAHSKFHLNYELEDLSESVSALPTRYETVSDLFNMDSHENTSKLPSAQETWVNQHPESSLWESLDGTDDQFLIFTLAAIGRLHLLLEGSPGIGKSTWCRAFREILPPLSRGDWAERIQNSTNLDQNAHGESPFEAPHHSASSQSLVGGGSRIISAGAITQADKGVLFLDEFTEFPRNVREALREPMEAKKIQIYRNGVRSHLPADFQLLATMNPCACGHYESKLRCTCTPKALMDYRSKVSGPLLDRIHFHSWWMYHSQKPSPHFRLRELRPKILKAREEKFQMPVHLQFPEFHNPRRRRIFTEIFSAWCRFFEIGDPKQKQLQECKDFYDRNSASFQKV